MIHRVGSFEAKTRLSELLRLAEQGDEVVILRRGERVAVIVGPARYDQMSRRLEMEPDWRRSAREYLGRGPRMEREEFNDILREAKESRP
ncbi:MAG: Antitoxin Phd YefM, type toxin-antitoxin system [Planctomycetota bacterium]|jgi:prevent-host-death family protein